MNLAFLGGIGILFVKLKRPPKDDPRLSKGLQLLENKIAILSDLSDRTDAQVKQLTTLMDQKGRQIQEKIQAVEEHIQKVNASIEKSIEASRIFSSDNPKEEYAERQNVSKYVQAARMANKGYSAEQIAEKISLPLSELEFIVKVNKDKLMFANELVPPWIESEDVFENKPSITKDLSQIFEAPKVNQDANQRLVDDLKKAVVEAKEKWTIENTIPQSTELPMAVRAPVAPSSLKPNALKAVFEVDGTTEKTKETKETKEKVIRPYEFKKLNGITKGMNRS